MNREVKTSKVWNLQKRNKEKKLWERVLSSLSAKAVFDDNENMVEKSLKICNA